MPFAFSPQAVIANLTSGFTGDADKQTIREATDIIAKHTCIRFVERTNQDDYIEFYEDSK